jgi:predicted nuclease with TOPRIM domain
VKKQLEKRLAQLKAEFESGQRVMAELETKQANLRDTLLRISGAIQILEEELGKVDREAENSSDRESSGALNKSEVRIDKTSSILK